MLRIASIGLGRVRVRAPRAACRSPHCPKPGGNRGFGQSHRNRFSPEPNPHPAPSGRSKNDRKTVRTGLPAALSPVALGLTARPLARSVCLLSAPVNQRHPMVCGKSRTQPLLTVCKDRGGRAAW